MTRYNIDMKEYNSIKQAHEQFEFPGSYRRGCIIKDNIVIRVYSNSVSAPDFMKIGKNKIQFFYTLKSALIQDAFKNTKKTNNLVHVFTRNIDTKKVEYYGKFKVKGFRENNKYVLLEN